MYTHNNTVIERRLGWKYNAQITTCSVLVHLRFVRTFTAAALTTPAARSHSFRDSAAVTARRMLGRASTTSCPLNRRARVIHTPCASASSTISCNSRSSTAISNAGGAGLDDFAVVAAIGGWA